MSTTTIITKLTVLVDPNNPLGKILKSTRSSSPHDIHFVAKDLNVTACGVHCLVSNIGTAFVFAERPMDVPARFGHSFRRAVCILNLNRMDPEQVSECQRRAPDALFTLAFDAEEAAEYVMAFIVKSNDANRQAEAKRRIVQAATVDPQQAAIRAAELGLPISLNESRILLECCGSWAKLVRMSSANEIANRSPLSDQDAMRVAEALGLNRHKAVGKSYRVGTMGQFL